ncbi:MULTISPECIES: hypothetical protein [Shewanella]|uniref:hypothetical protein n=1 Tax=Shewanella TaxID=22 RepID=UPI001CFAE030|nr:hypothetical protein [Shewanella chilikensis]MCE9853495.1 hypothetical protein [Shewanella chilikensis]
MQKYTLYTSRKDTIGSDGEVNLRLYVTLDSAPQRLSDFAGGVAEIYDGYSTDTCNFAIELASFDPRRIALKSINGEEIVINPEFIQAAQLNQLEEIPLKLNQNLSGYIVKNSSWGLR